MFARRLRVLGSGGLRPVIRRVLVTHAAIGEGIAKSETYGLNVRSGRLRASIGSAVRDTDAGAELALQAGRARGGRDVIYAGVHEGLRPDGSRATSTTIRPKNGKFLRIPTVWAMTLAGVDRNPGPLRQTAPGRFRVVAGGDGRLFLVPNAKGRRGAEEPPWYLLVPSVTIRARPFLLPAMQRVRPLVAAGISRAVAEAVQGG
jgi:hypothetical protein